MWPQPGAPSACPAQGAVTGRKTGWHRGDRSPSARPPPAQDRLQRQREAGPAAHHGKHQEGAPDAARATGATGGPHASEAAPARGRARSENLLHSLATAAPIANPPSNVPAVTASAFRRRATARRDGCRPHPGKTRRTRLQRAATWLFLMVRVASSQRSAGQYDNLGKPLRRNDH